MDNTGVWCQLQCWHQEGKAAGRIYTAGVETDCGQKEQGSIAGSRIYSGRAAADSGGNVGRENGILSNKKIKVFSHVAAAAVLFVFFLLAFWIYQKGIDRAAEQAAEKVMEEMQQQAAEGQENSGSVTIYLQGSERYEKAEDACNSLDSAISSLEEVVEYVTEATE